MRITVFEKISLVKSDKTFTKDAKNSEKVNTFFANAVKKLKIPEYEEISPFAEKLSHLILKKNFRYSKRGIIIVINNVTN